MAIDDAAHAIHRVMKDSKDELDRILNSITESEPLPAAIVSRVEILKNRIASGAMWLASYAIDYEQTFGA